MFRKMPFIMAIMIIFIVLLSPIIPLYIKQLLYSISLSIKSIILFILPFIIFSLLFKASVILSRNATKVIGIIVIFVCCSNFLSTFISHYIGIWIYSSDLANLQFHNIDNLTTLWLLHLPNIISNSDAMITGVILGIFASTFFPKKAEQLAVTIEIYIESFLNNFIFFVPLFVVGFVIKMQHDGILELLTKEYALIFSLIAISQFTYIIICYLLLNKFSFIRVFNNIKRVFPAVISGFSTMSSAASMPLLIMGLESNTKNKDVVRAVVPATINIHLIGDCFAIPILAYAILKGFGMEEPPLVTYIVFIFYFILAKFSVVAVPGGGIIVMLPLLESYLGFNSEMLSLITALYILFDPVITAANVLGNGAFAKLIDKMLSYMQKTKYQLSI